MRFYNTSDVDFFINIRNKWDTYCKYGPDKSWSSKSPLQVEPKIWPIYIDLKGARKEIIEDKDLRFQCWPVSRINSKSCLPVLYATGRRFIKLEQAGPVGFKCAPFPMNLREVGEAIVKEKELQKAKKREQKLRKILLELCKKKDSQKQ